VLKVDGVERQGSAIEGAGVMEERFSLFTGEQGTAPLARRGIKET